MRLQPPPISIYFPHPSQLHVKNAYILLSLHSNLSFLTSHLHSCLSVAPIYPHELFLLSLSPSILSCRVSSTPLHPIHSSVSQHSNPLLRSLPLAPFHLVLFSQLFLPPKHPRFRQPFIPRSHHMTNPLQYCLFNLPFNRFHSQIIPFIIHVYVPFAHLSQRLTIPITPHISISVIHFCNLFTSFSCHVLA